MTPKTYAPSIRISILLGMAALIPNLAQAGEVQLVNYSYTATKQMYEEFDPAG